jgi:hypothetical protein
VKFASILLLVLSPFLLAQPLYPPQKTAPPKTSTPPAGTTQVAPDEGAVNGNAYTSDYFHFTYTIPDDLAVEEDFMQGHEDVSKRSFVLLAAYGPSEKEGFRRGVVVAADALDTPATTESQYLRKLTGEQFESKGFEISHPQREYTIAGHGFSRADYRKTDVYQSVVVAIWRGYAVVFNLVAPSAEEIDGLFASVEGVKLVTTAPAKAPKPPARSTRR